MDLTVDSCAKGVWVALSIEQKKKKELMKFCLPCHCTTHEKKHLQSEFHIPFLAYKVLILFDGSMRIIVY